VGAILYGSGYVLLAFIRADLVERWHWLTEAQLLDDIIKNVTDEIFNRLFSNW